MVRYVILSKDGTNIFCKPNLEGEALFLFTSEKEAEEVLKEWRRQNILGLASLEDPGTRIIPINIQD